MSGSSDFLLAEDLLLLLLDDERGRLAAADTARPLLGGALLVELALAGAVDVEPGAGRWRSAKVVVTPGASGADPLLGRALAVVREKPRTAVALVDRIGKGVREELQDRLVSRGVLERREHRALGLFPVTRWPAADVEHERAVRDRLEAALVRGLDPDPRTAALIALLGAVDQAHRCVDRGTVPAREVRRRVREISEGDWGAKAVSDAVRAASAAVTSAVVATTVVVGGS